MKYHDVHVRVDPDLFKRWENLPAYHGRKSHLLRIAIKKIVEALEGEGDVQFEIKKKTEVPA